MVRLCSWAHRSRSLSEQSERLSGDGSSALALLHLLWARFDRIYVRIAWVRTSRTCRYACNRCRVHGHLMRYTTDP
jgi:hypothetical protein